MDMDSDNRFDNELSEEDVARATEVTVPAPDATPLPDIQAVGERQDAAERESTDADSTDNQAAGLRQPVPYVSQQEFPSAALMDDGKRRVSLGRVAGVSAAVGVAGVSVASVLAKEDASLSRAATPDDEKSADEIAANVGVGDDVERIQVPAEPHVTITYEDITAADAAQHYNPSGAAVACNSDYASADYAGCADTDADLSNDFGDIYDTLG